MIVARSIWKDGRFSWSAIGAVVFLTVSLLGFDVAWRAISLQFDTLLIYSILVDAAAALVLIVIVRLLTRTRRPL